ncbi:MAG: hypothetical protein FWC57_06875 [Endomicrobia bacterium]|nr:hypothetical protein [Endomicrobiia bacterium]
MKNINRLLACLCVIAASSLFFYAPMHLYNLISGYPANDFSIQWPFVRILTEPLYAFSFYAITLNRNFYAPAIISWAAWTFFAALLYNLIKRRELKRLLINIAYSMLFLATLFAAAALLPLPGPKLIKPQGYIAVDLHSHTIASHDNISDAQSSLRFHALEGFDAFFDTEHNHTKGFGRFPPDVKMKDVFPGMQMSTRDGVSVILLSPKPFDGYQYDDMHLRDLIYKAHSNGMIVLMPHWWKWHKYTFEELDAMGIDGFEIYNCGYRYFGEAEQKKMIDFARDRNLIMTGSTDWHGWGYMSDVWTVIQGQPGDDIMQLLSKKPVTKVLLYRENQSASAVRFIFEPFAAFYYYAKNADLTAILSFMAWFSVLFILFSKKAGVYIKIYFPLAMSIVFGALVVYFYLIYIQFQELNQIIPVTMLPVTAGFCILWIFIWRLRSHGKII